jgi:hypothetical protein
MVIVTATTVAIKAYVAFRAYSLLYSTYTTMRSAVRLICRFF